MIAALAFYVFAAILIASAVMVVTSRNPVHSVLFLILAFFNAAALMLTKGTPKRSADELSDEVEALGAGVGSQGGNNTWYSRGTCLKEDWKTILSIVADTTLNATFPEEEWKKIQPRLLDFDPFRTSPREQCTVGALRAKARHVDLNPITTGKGLAPVAPGTTRPVTIADIQRQLAGALDGR